MFFGSLFGSSGGGSGTASPGTRYVVGVIGVYGDDGREILARTVVQSDTAPDLLVQIVDEAGTPLDLTGFGATFDMWLLGASTPTIDKQACAIEYAALGYVSYSWQSGDLATAGTYRARFYLTSQSGKTMSAGYLTITIQSRFGT